MLFGEDGGHYLCGLDGFDEWYFDREGAVGVADDDVALAQHLVAFLQVGQAQARVAHVFLFGAYGVADAEGAVLCCFEGDGEGVTVADGVVFQGVFNQVLQADRDELIVQVAAVDVALDFEVVP